MKVAKITLWDSSIYYTDNLDCDFISGFFRKVKEMPQFKEKGFKSTHVCELEFIEITEKEYHAIPATQEAAKVFKQ